MNMPTPPQQEASRDRRRRQNRESQRRWRERYRQANGDNRIMPQDMPSRADDAPPILETQSPPQSKGSPDSQHVNGYCVQYTNWVQDQLAGHLDSHISSWPPIDFNFPLQQQDKCYASTHSQNGEVSREGSTNGGCLNGLEDEAPIYASPESITCPSPRIRGQLPHFPSAGTCRPALPSSSSAGSAAVDQSALCNAHAPYRDVETASTAEETIRDVQLLYRIGVKAGFLKRDDKVKCYLAAMKRIYHKVHTLMDEEDYEGPIGSDLDEWSD